MFESRFEIFVVPGMGATSCPWWWTHARANWDGLHPFLPANSLTFSNMLLLCSKFCAWKRGSFWNYQMIQNYDAELTIRTLNKEAMSSPFCSHHLLSFERSWPQMIENPFLEGCMPQFQCLIPYQHTIPKVSLWSSMSLTKFFPIPARRNDVLFDISCPQRPLELNRWNGMNCMSSSNGRRRGFRQTNVPYFPFFNQFLQLPNLKRKPLVITHQLGE